MSMFYGNIHLHIFYIRIQSDVSPILYSGITRISNAVSDIQLSRFALPVGSKDNCALLVPKHTRGATVNCQVYSITTYTLIQAFFYKIHKKNNKSCCRFYIYNVRNCRGQFFYANIRSHMRTLARTYVRPPQNRTRRLLKYTG